MAGFYSARSETIPPLPWPNFAPPFPHWDGILNAFDNRLTNGGVEAINGLIQVAKGRARGYRTTRNFINVAYLVAGDFTNLPASPYTTTSGPVVS